MACYVVRATFVAGAAVAEEFCKIDQFESKIRRDVTVHDLHINRRRRRRRRSFDQQGLSGWWNVSKVAGKIDFELRNESCSHFFSPWNRGVVFQSGCSDKICSNLEQDCSLCHRGGFLRRAVKPLRTITAIYVNYIWEDGEIFSDTAHTGQQTIMADIYLFRLGLGAL